MPPALDTVGSNINYFHHHTAVCPPSCSHACGCLETTQPGISYPRRYKGFASRFSGVDRALPLGLNGGNFLRYLQRKQVRALSTNQALWSPMPYKQQRRRLAPNTLPVGRTPRWPRQVTTQAQGLRRPPLPAWEAL